MAKWEQHFDKLQHGLTFDENNPDVTENSENENCNKKSTQNDAAPSQNKSYDKHNTHSLDKCAKNIVKRLRAIPRCMNNDKGKKRTRNSHKTGQKGECQSLCFCNQKYIWDSDEKNITDLRSWKKCDHWKGQ